MERQCAGTRFREISETRLDSPEFNCQPWQGTVFAGEGPIPKGIAHLDQLLNLQNIAFAGHHHVEHGIEEEAEQQPRDQTGDDNDCERFLGI